MTAHSAKQLAPYLEPLTEIQRIFVECKLKGMTDVAAATAAGVSNPQKNAYNVKQSKAVQEAISKGIEFSAHEVMFTRKKAHELLMDAHRNAKDATEQVLAIREMIKLHGVAAPEVKEIHTSGKVSIEHREVRELSDEELLRLARLPTEQLPAIIEGEYEIVDGRPDGEVGGEEAGASGDPGETAEGETPDHRA